MEGFDRPKAGEPGPAFRPDALGDAATASAYNAPKLASDESRRPEEKARRQIDEANWIDWHLPWTRHDADE
jgi:hypothetical protein